ncbi:hypothetical protein KY289_032466 [Solanum tuberosum]|nr:hypothetical protein KY289_032466 [Solanum tuberosum]
MGYLFFLSTGCPALGYLDPRRRLPPCQIRRSHVDSTNQIAGCKTITHQSSYNNHAVFNYCNGVSDFGSPGLVALAAVEAGNFASSMVVYCSAQMAGSKLD